MKTLFFFLVFLAQTEVNYFNSESDTHPAGRQPSCESDVCKNHCHELKLVPRCAWNGTNYSGHKKNMCVCLTRQMIKFGVDPYYDTFADGEKYREFIRKFYKISGIPTAAPTEKPWVTHLIRDLRDRGYGADNSKPPEPPKIISAVVEFESCPDAKYVDVSGTAWACKECRCIPYYKELEDHNDPGRCGVYPFETGTWDPLYFVCRRHDAMYNFQKDNDGKVKESIIKTQWDFTRGAAVAAVTGVVSILGFFLYTPLVWTVGTGIQVVRKLRGKDE